MTLTKSRLDSRTGALLFGIPHYIGTPGGPVGGCSPSVSWAGS